MRFSSSSSTGGRLFLGLFFFLEGRAGGGGADLAFARRLPRRSAICSARRALGQHRFEIEDLAQLHRAFVEGVRPFDDRVEGDRAFAQAPDHRVAAGLDALGDGDFALAAEQFDRAHFAQVHADRVVGAVDRFLLGRDGRARAAVVERIDLVLGLGSSRLVLVVGIVVVLDDVDAHLRDRGHDVLDLLGRHLVLRQRLVDFVIGDDAALLGAGDQFLDRSVVEVDQRRIAASRFRFRGFVFRHSPLYRAAYSLLAEDASRSLICLTRRMQPLLFLEGLFVAGHQPLGGLGERRLDLAVGRQRLDRQPKVATAQLRIGVAAGEGKADIAALRRAAPSRRRLRQSANMVARPSRSSAAPENGEHRRMRSRRRAVRASAIGSAASCLEMVAERLGE